MWYVVLECYPAEDSDKFSSHSLAIAGCWVLESLAETQDAAEQVARDKLEQRRWGVVDVMSIDVVDANSYDDGSEKRAFFEQALLDEFVTHIHQVPRQHLPHHQAPPELLKGMFEKAVQQIRANGAFTFLGSEGEQGVGEIAEEHFFPLWGTRDDAALNSDEWPDCSLVAVSTAELKHEYLVDMHSRDLLLALGLDGTAMVLFHPLALRDAVARRS